MKLNEEMVHTACAHFDRYGGSFNRTLAQLWRIADSSNKEILMQAFKDHFIDAFEQAMDYREWKRQQALTLVSIDKEDFYEDKDKDE